MSDIASSPRCLVIIATKDEGAFLLESIAWYRALGFEVMILTNDCTDSSPAMLDLLATHGIVYHVRHNPNGRMLPKRSAHKAARAHPILSEFDWILVCDVDELLVLHTVRSIQDFLSKMDTERFTCMGINWRIFGTNGYDHYEDVFQHQRFVLASQHMFGMNRWHKTLFRTPEKFTHFREHSPFLYNGTWGEGGARYVNSEGFECTYMSPQTGSSNMLMSHHHVTHLYAQMNHYALRSLEDFSVKIGVPSPSSGRQRHTERFFQLCNKNDCIDRSASLRNHAFFPEYDRISTLPGINALHHLCCAQRVARLRQKVRARAEKDPRFQYHMDLAGVPKAAR